MSALGRGGQGVVYEVIDGKGVDPPDVLASRIANAVSNLASIAQTPERLKTNSEKLVTGIRQFTLDDAPRGALKVLHPPEDSMNPATAVERMRRELDVLGATSHPALIRVLDSNLDERWLVTEFQSGGTLAANLGRFRGRAMEALLTFRPIVEAVQHLHNAQIVHRDIKPDNVFIGGDGRLILGDCGLAIEVEHGERLTETFENAGSRDWMPGWAQGMRLEDVRPNFDVFSLGKLLWAMVSGRKKLQLWYYNRPPNDLTEMFPGDDAVAQIHWLLGRAIVEFPDACLPNAGALLEEVDRIIAGLQSGNRLVNGRLNKKCVFCADGQYITISNRDGVRQGNFGLNVVGGAKFRIMACTACGHVQLFYHTDELELPAWKGV